MNNLDEEIENINLGHASKEELIEALEKIKHSIYRKRLVVESIFFQLGFRYFDPNENKSHPNKYYVPEALNKKIGMPLMKYGLEKFGSLKRFAEYLNITIAELKEIISGDKIPSKKTITKLINHGFDDKILKYYYTCPYYKNHEAVNNYLLDEDKITIEQNFKMLKVLYDELCIQKKLFNDISCKIKVNAKKDEPKR